MVRPTVVEQYSLTNTSCSKGWLRWLVQLIFGTLIVSSFILIVLMALNSSHRGIKRNSRCTIMNCRVICNDAPFYGNYEDDIVNAATINLNLGQKELVDYCQKNNILVVAYTPFGRMVPSRLDTTCPAVRHDDPIILNIAKKYGKSGQQIALRYLYQRGICSIPKTLTKTRVVENASIFDFQIDDADVATLKNFDNNYRTVRPVFWQNFNNYPFDKLDVVVPGIPLSLRKWKNGANLDID